MRALRWLGYLVGTLFVLGALAFLLFLPEDIREYGREPEDVWLGTAWIVVLGLLAILCFWSARRLGRTQQK